MWGVCLWLFVVVVLDFWFFRCFCLDDDLGNFMIGFVCLFIFLLYEVF